MGMHLTPIKIRGKKRPPRSHPDHAPPTKKREFSQPRLSLREIRSLSQTQSKRGTPRLTPKLASAKRNKLSILESLPVELIERIFLYSLNVNFPRSSPVLSSAVSNERIYRALVLLAFWDDSVSASASASGVDAVGNEGLGNAHAGERSIVSILRPLDYVPLTDLERGELQRMAVQCRWFSVKRLLGLLPDLMNLVIQRHWVCAGVQMEEEQRSALERFMGKKEDVRVFEGVGKDNQRWTLTVEPLISVTVSNEETGQLTTHSVLGVVVFPEKLLRGENGFSEEDATLLETLRIASGYNRSENLGSNNITLSRDVLQQGIHNALVEHDARVLTTLLKIDEYFIRSLNSNMADSLPYSLPEEHFRTAVRVSPDDSTLFQLLLRASAESIPGDDSEITEWAMDLGSPLGNWVLELMMRLPEQVASAKENPAEGSVFYLGGANGRTELGRRYLDEVSDVSELHSWMAETSFDISSLWGVGES